MNQSLQFIERLQMGLPQVLVIYGTSLSFHLAPLLRRELDEHYGGLLTVVNLGMSAMASRTGLAELEGRVLRHHPDAVLTEFAVNDAYDYSNFPDGTLDKGITLAESKSNLETIIERIYLALPRCEIILQTMNPTFDSTINQDMAGSRRSDLNSFYNGYREVAAARGLNLIDNYALWEVIRDQEPERFKSLIPDGAHPTPAALRTVVVPHILQQLQA